MLKNFKLVLHGTFAQPDYMKNGPRVYHETSVNDVEEDIAKEETVS